MRLRFLPVIIPCLIVNQRHEFHIFIGVVFQAVELAHFNQAHVAGADAGDGFIVVNEIRGALEDVVGFGVTGVLVPAHGGAGRKNHLGIHAAVTQQFILGYDVVHIGRALAAGQALHGLDIGFTNHIIPSSALDKPSIQDAEGFVKRQISGIKIPSFMSFPNLNNVIKYTCAIYQRRTFMKRKICLFAALLMCVFSFTAAFAAYTVSLCADTSVYADPGYYGYVAQVIDADGVFTIVEEQRDAYGNLWGKLKSGAGWVALSSEDYLQPLYAGDEIYAGPGFDFPVADGLTEDGTFTIVASAWDGAGNLWGKLKSGAGWVFLRGGSAMIYSPIYADFASEELIAKGPYEYVLVDESLNASEIAIYANETLTDVCFFQAAHDGGVCIENPLYNLPVLTAEKPLVAAVGFYGSSTAYGISFTDGAGMQRCFEFSISGLDGSLVMSECTAAHI